MWPFSQKRAQPARVPTDTVIPMHFFDDNLVNRSVLLDFTLRFDDVLNPEKLRNALVRLMELGNWKKLGARLRQNEIGKLEHHVPVRYDEKRPGFNYTHVKYDMSIEEHPLASQLPQASNRPSVEAGPEHFESLARRPDAPKKLDDYLHSDEPQLSVHIVSFEDSTLVSLTWPHTYFDAMGRATFFNAWTLVLNGQEDKVPPFNGFKTDPLAPLGFSMVEESMLAKYQVKGLSILLFTIRYIFEFIWWRKEENHTVCLPAAYLQSMKQTIMQELAAQSQGDSKPFVSDGDVICAWWTRLALQHLSPTSRRTVVILNAFGLRGVLSKDLLPAGTAYTSNAVYRLYTILAASDVFQRPLSYLASQIRRSIREQGTRSQIEALASLHRKNMGTTGRPAVFGDSTTQLMVFSNWSKAKFHEIDFSAAVTKLGTPLEKRANALGRPSYVHSVGHTTKFSSRYAFAIFGKDAAGNYWLSGILRTGSWKKIEQDLAAM